MATYVNPAAAVGECRRAGKRTKRDLVHCAVDRAPYGASSRWYLEVNRLVEASGLSGSRRRRRRKRR